MSPVWDLWRASGYHSDARSFRQLDSCWTVSQSHAASKSVVGHGWGQRDLPLRWHGHHERPSRRYVRFFAAACTGDVLVRAVAFALVIGSAAATAIGASVPLLLELPCACCARWRKPAALDRILAVGLGFAAGVMLYVSFVEIFSVKGLGAFATCFTGDAGRYGYLYGTLCFFGKCVRVCVVVCSLFL